MRLRHPPPRLKLQRAEWERTKIVITLARPPGTSRLRPARCGALATTAVSRRARQRGPGTSSARPKRMRCTHTHMHTDLSVYLICFLTTLQVSAVRSHPSYGTRKATDAQSSTC